eukprot:jgi/Orpsp1_1/1176730/evm.model.c7180000058785.1
MNSLSVITFNKNILIDNVYYKNDDKKLKSNNLLAFVPIDFYNKDYVFGIPTLGYSDTSMFFLSFENLNKFIDINDSELKIIETDIIKKERSFNDILNIINQEVEKERNEINSTHKIKIAKTIKDSKVNYLVI